MSNTFLHLLDALIVSFLNHDYTEADEKNELKCFFISFNVIIVQKTNPKIRKQSRSY
jgi:hypothetical protein